MSGDLVDRLRSRDPGERVLALQDLSPDALQDSAVLRCVFELLDDPEFAPPELQPPGEEVGPESAEGAVTVGNVVFTALRDSTLPGILETIALLETLAGKDPYRAMDLAAATRWERDIEADAVRRLAPPLTAGGASAAKLWDGLGPEGRRELCDSAVRLGTQGSSTLRHLAEADGGVDAVVETLVRAPVDVAAPLVSTLRAVAPGAARPLVQALARGGHGMAMGCLAIDDPAAVPAFRAWLESLPAPTPGRDLADVFTLDDGPYRLVTGEHDWPGWRPMPWLLSALRPAPDHFPLVLFLERSVGVDPRFFWALRHLEAAGRADVHSFLVARAAGWMSQLDDPTSRSGLAFAIRAGAAPSGAAKAVADVLDRAPSSEWPVLMSEADVPPERRFELGLRMPMTLPDLAPLLEKVEPDALRRFVESYVRLCEAAPTLVEEAKEGPLRVRVGVAPGSLEILLDPARADDALRRRIQAVLPRPEPSP